MDGLLVVTLESVSTDTITFVVHEPINFASAEDSRLLGGPVRGNCSLENFSFLKFEILILLEIQLSIV